MTASTPRRFTALKLVQVLGIVTLLSACGAEEPYVERFDWGYAHRSELEAWAAKEVDATIAGTGLGTEGWSLFRKDPPLMWDADREAVLSAARTGPCTVEHVEWARPWRLELTVMRDGTKDAFAVAERVRTHWTADGWTVSDVITPQDMRGVEDPFISIRADKEGEREMLAFMANPNIFFINTYSDCSEDASMMH